MLFKFMNVSLFTGAFLILSMSVSHADSHQPHMENTHETVSTYEYNLFLTPGGKYTQDDITANGALTPAQKFKGFKAKHNPRPQSGDMICPITLTKANALCTWVVGGREYQFCCPACIDEFLMTAKERPEEILDPETYVKR